MTVHERGDDPGDPVDDAVDDAGGSSAARSAGTDTWISTGSLTLGVVVAVLSWLAYRRARSRRRRGAQP